MRWDYLYPAIMICMTPMAVQTPDRDRVSLRKHADTLCSNYYGLRTQFDFYRFGSRDQRDQRQLVGPGSNADRVLHGGQFGKDSSSTSPAGQMSPRNLLVTTVCDELRLATNFRSKVVELPEGPGRYSPGRTQRQYRLLV